MNHKLIVGAALAGALELVGHWFPWPKPLHKLGAYMYGVAAILTGVAAATDRTTTVKTATVSVVAGIATIAAYIVDIHLKAKQRRRMYGSNG